MIIFYLRVTLRWIVIVGLIYGSYVYLVCIEGFEFVQFITIIGVIIALLKEFIVELLFPPIFKIKISNSKPHYYEYQTTSKQEKQSWLAVEIKNVGLWSAKNVLVYFDGIASNIVEDFDAYLGLPVRKAFGEIPEKIDPTPKPSILSVGDKIYYSFLKIKDIEPSSVYFKFSDTPVALNRIKCNIDEENFFKFRIKITTDRSWALHKSAIFKVSYNGNYNQGIKI